MSEWYAQYGTGEDAEFEDGWRDSKPIEEPIQPNDVERDPERGSHDLSPRVTDIIPGRPGDESGRMDWTNFTDFQVDSATLEQAVVLPSLTLTGFLTAQPARPDEYAKLVIADGAIAYWRLNDTGAYAIDSGNNGHHAFYSGSAVQGQPNASGTTPEPTGIMQGQPGIGIDPSTAFAGSVPGGFQTYIEVNNFTFPSPPKVKLFTVEAWFQTTALRGVIVSQSGTHAESFDTPPGWNLIVASGSVGFFLFNGSASSVSVGIDLSANAWHHVCAVFIGPNPIDPFAPILFLYLDGVLVNSTYMFGLIAGAPGIPIHIGGGFSSGGPPFFHPSDGFIGNLADIAFYDHALTPDQIALHNIVRRTGS